MNHEFKVDVMIRKGHKIDIFEIGLEFFRYESSIFLDEAGLQTALQGLATATGITTSTISATLGGIAGILYPKPAGEGSDVIPQ